MKKLITLLLLLNSAVVLSQQNVQVNNDGTLKNPLDFFSKNSTLLQGALPLTFTANATGFSIAGGTSSKTLTLSNNATLSGTSSGTNTGDQTAFTIDYSPIFGDDLSYQVGSNTVREGIRNLDLYKEPILRIVSVSYASSITLNADPDGKSNMSAGTVLYRLAALTGNTFFNTPTNPHNARKIIIEIPQDSTGGHIVGWSSAFYDPKTNSTVESASHAASMTRVLQFVYNSTSSKWVLYSSGIDPVDPTAFRHIFNLTTNSIGDGVSGLSAGSTSQNLFSTFDNSTPTYVRSTTCFPSVAGIDMTPVSVWASDGTDTRVTLIGSDLAIGSHTAYPGNGATVRFVKANGTVVTATVSSSLRIGTTDVRVIRFTSDIEAQGISVAKYISTRNQHALQDAAVCYTDVNNKAYIGLFNEIDADNFGVTSFSAHSTFYKSGGGVSGDIGNPIGAFIDGKFVILGFTSTVSLTQLTCPSIASYAASINSAAGALGATGRLVEKKMATSLAAQADPGAYGLQVLAAADSDAVIAGKAAKLWDPTGDVAFITADDSEIHYTNFGYADWDTNAYNSFKQGLGFFDTYDVGWPITAVSSGTAYTLTNSSAALDFGTTDPVLTIPDSDENHEYKIDAEAVINYVGATFGSDQTITFKLRRTNHTATDVTDSSVDVNTQTMTTATYPGIPVHICAIYDQASGVANDTIEIFASISATPSAGSVKISSAKILVYKTK